MILTIENYLNFNQNIERVSYRVLKLYFLCFNNHIEHDFKVFVHFYPSSNMFAYILSLCKKKKKIILIFFPQIVNIKIRCEDGFALRKFLIQISEEI